MKIIGLVTVASIVTLITVGPEKSHASSVGVQPAPGGGAREKPPNTSAPAPSPTADEPFYRPNQSPYQVNLVLDLGVIVVGSLLASVPRIMVNEGDGPWCGLSCDLDDVNALDRAVMTDGSQTAGDISDYVMYGYISSTFIMDAIDVMASGPHDGWRGFGRRPQ